MGKVRAQERETYVTLRFIVWTTCLVKEIKADGALPVDDIYWAVAGVQDKRPAPPE
jgi:hypothetical protein